jgi:hypothetical protein
LREFSDRVNDIKREEGEQRPLDELVSDDLGKEAVRYLRAVERAASDRLSRVRRNDALLSAVIGPALATGTSSAFTAADEEWSTSKDGDLLEDEDEVEDEDEESNQSLAAVNETLPS